MRSLSSNPVVTGFVLLFAMFFGIVKANAVCVTNAGQLQTQLNAGAQQTQPFTIKLAQGTYVLSGNITVFFGAPARIEGGYNAQCTAQIVNAANTVIDLGGGDNFLLEYDGSPKAMLAIDGITFKNAASLAIAAGDINCGICSDTPGELYITNSRFTGMTRNISDDWGLVTFDAVNGSATLINVQFDHLTDLNAAHHCEVAMEFDGDTTTTLEYITADLSGGKDFCLQNWIQSGDHHVDIYNSIFWASDGTLGSVRGTYDTFKNNQEPINVSLIDDLYRGYYGIGPSTSFGQQFPAAAAPLWVNPAAFNYALAPNSASGTNVAINSGSLVVPKGNPLRDITFNVRSVGSAPDLGAYESPYNDSDLFTVTNFSDCAGAGCGSLRDAIQLATISSNPSVSIRFSIPGGCPAVITLSGPLPDITKAMQIDGNTQSGAVANSDAEAFNATLCVVVQPAIPAPYYAFRVPAAASNASLYLSGIAFGDFPIDVELLGGANHQIASNQFGGLINNNTYQLYGSAVIGVYMDVPSGKAIIGGSDPAKRNVFLNTTSFGGQPASAIQVGYHVNAAANSCQIIGNTIGVQDDGTFTTKNTDYGIYVQGNGCAVRDNRIAGVYKDAIYIDSSAGGGNHNIVQNNILGLVPYGFDFTTSNLGAGIRVTGSHNMIGFGPIAGGVASFYGNQVRNMDAGAVVINGSGTGNTVRGNAMFDNGSGGDAMSIDLGGNGPTADDFGDSDGGPNNLQNFPVLHGIAWPAPPKIGDTKIATTLKGTIDTYFGPGAYQVDAYYAHGCNATGRGTAEQWIGSVDAVAVAAGSYTASFSIAVVIPDYDPANGTLSVTATNTLNGEGSTSELSRCFAVDTIFKDGAE